ncbi:class I SAM-dependent methyltransferase [Streptomyces sp. NPDC005925]|uniref:class I SAM-dependent methyltransferase n=1 Tax=Streptomyces sp. NPDC005925 TaxID=3157172 RepID=UPI0033EE689C
MSVTSRYRQSWESFWSEASGEQGAVFWDAEPVLTSAPHLALFEPYLPDPGLPMVDLGCGNGTQTRFLADRFPRVLGVDLSTAALGHARRADPGGQASYRVVDAAEKTETDALRGDLGEANVYVRGVLHQSEPDDRQSFVDGLAALIGEHGRAFVIEPSRAAEAVLLGLAEAPGGPPAKLAPVLRHGITPGAMADDEMPEFLRSAGLTVLAAGELPLKTTEYGPDGTRLEVPSRWLVTGRSAG